MRTYQLYLIEDEFASHYFGRERMFYQLFQEYSRSKGELRSILSRQIEFITRPIPALRLHQYLTQQLSRKKGASADQGAYVIRNGKNSSARLEIYDRCLVIESHGNYDAETVFFEILRKNESSYLAVDMTNRRFGWLKPIKERKFI
ncbi:sporulation inhibitor of replication protein SirA [Bacillus infantis]|uniref:Sporulation inhibitor of replication protein SirA n=1 Tax=Bacillus infantis TaxID=324767 RepID=A0A5D4R892_9BACI|nr:sporulation inhibitor of replication protein SirA [Bacillus infantis]TYS46739.1 sporulation inhibitor of replication protein SirA [Bacillus infantis]